jgi:hypothetical protein
MGHNASRLLSRRRARHGNCRRILDHREDLQRRSSSRWRCVCWSSETSFRLVEDRRADYPVTIRCGLLGVSPDDEIHRQSGTRQRYHRAACGRYGSPRIHADLGLRAAAQAEAASSVASA